MSYAIYSTEGFILGSMPSGEASKTYWIYTKDFGLIKAKAQSVRLLSSKLRYSLDDFSFATYSLVRGKEIWRITGVHDTKGSKESLGVRARVLSLVRRLVQGEERNEKLFSTLLWMVGDFVLSKEEETFFELLVLAHVLSSLGYIDIQKTLGLSLENGIAINQLSGIKEKKREVIFEINKALKETQL